MNLIDDGISMTPRHGLKLNPLGSFSRVISFFKKKSQKNPEFSVEIDDNDLEGLSVNNSDGKSIIKIKNRIKLELIPINLKIRLMLMVQLELKQELDYIKKEKYLLTESGIKLLIILTG